MNRFFIAALTAVFIPVVSLCQEQRPSSEARLAIATNVADYLYLLTPNIDVQYSAGRCVTAEAGAKYNNWSFRGATPQEVKNRQQTYYLGARWWPWYSFSGWWLGACVQFQEYDRGGVFRQDSEAGNAFGLNLGAGYSLQIAKWLNIDLGVGFWGGRTNYTLYECPYCGKVVEEGSKAFVLPNEARLALQFIF